MENLNSQFIISMLIIALGYISKKMKIVSETDGDALSKIVINFTLPAAVISTFSSVRVDKSLTLLPLVGFGYGILMTLLALFIFRKEPRDRRGMLSMLIPGFNIGLFAYPLVESLWGERGITYFAMFDMGNAIIVFVVCYVLASHFSTDNSALDVKGMLKSTVKSVPLMSYIITLTVNLSGLHFPGILVDVSKVISKANTPLSLLLLGIYLSFSFDADYRRNMAKVLGTRYLVGLTTGILLYFLFPFDPLFRYTLLIGPILPIALIVIPYSVKFNYDKRFVGTVNNMTIVVTFLLIWLIFGIISSS